MITLWSNTASVFKPNAVTKAWQSWPWTCGHHGYHRRASGGASAAAECCILLFSPVVIRKCPAQSAVQTTPGLPKRPPTWPAQTNDCAQRERWMPCSRFHTGCWSGRHPQLFLHKHSTKTVETSAQNGDDIHKDHHYLHHKRCAPGQTHASC